jgi:hypothetical protein
VASIGVGLNEVRVRIRRAVSIEEAFVGRGASVAFDEPVHLTGEGCEAPESYHPEQNRVVRTRAMARDPAGGRP